MNRRPFDWRKDCPEDVARAFRPVAGQGRGKELSTEAVEEARRKMLPSRRAPGEAMQRVRGDKADL